MTKRIYIVTTIEPWTQVDFQEDEQLKMKIFTGEESCCKSLRSIGWFDNLTEAERIITNNVCDIHEGVYDYAVIENTPMGIYPMAFGKVRTDFKFYRFSRVKKQYEYVGEDIPTALCFSELNVFPTCLG